MASKSSRCSHQLGAVVLCLSVLAAMLVLLAAPHTANAVAPEQDTPWIQPAHVLEHIQTVVAGDYHTCALTSAGAVMCWGSSFYGQLGNGVKVDSAVPVPVTGLAGIKAIAAGSSHTCALTNAGQVKCWGWNQFGQLGDGTTKDRLTPVDVVGLPPDIRAIAAGGNHTCALVSIGVVKCWGWNQFGQLGDGTQANRLEPVYVAELINARAIAAGFGHTCAVLTAALEGGIKCWGANTTGQLGDGTAVERHTPVSVAGIGGGVLEITAGGFAAGFDTASGHTCAILQSGAVMCWGANDEGQLGDGTTGGSSTPVTVAALPEGIRTINAGAQHTCAASSSIALCWGADLYGQLGNGTTGASSTVQTVGELGGHIWAIAAGGEHSCAVTDGIARCWGANYYGQLGNFTAGKQWVPATVAGMGSSVAAVAGGASHTCALTGGDDINGRSAWCWGGNAEGQLGDGTTQGRLAPQPPAGIPTGVSAVAAGGEHTCALTGAGAARSVVCWGSGQITPTPVSGLSGPIQALAVGVYHACALTGDASTGGGVKCWGGNYRGQLGDGTTTNSSVPVDVLGLTSDVKAIAAGQNHTCALTVAGTVKCWGADDSGQLGGFWAASLATPQEVGGLGAPAQAITAGLGHTCALTEDGAVKCWGANESGQLGNGLTTMSYEPVDPIGLAGDVQAIAAGRAHTCALLGAGSNASVLCWGNNRAGQLGDGTTIDHLTPQPTRGLAGPALAIGAGNFHSCAIVAGEADAGSILQCWGDNFSAQVGVNPGWLPVDVVTPDAMLYLPSVNR